MYIIGVFFFVVRCVCVLRFFWQAHSSTHIIIVMPVLKWFLYQSTLAVVDLFFVPFYRISIRLRSYERVSTNTNRWRWLHYFFRKILLLWTKLLDDESRIFWEIAHKYLGQMIIYYIRMFCAKMRVTTLWREWTKSKKLFVNLTVFILSSLRMCGRNINSMKYFMKMPVYLFIHGDLWVWIYLLGNGTLFTRWGELI